jgi:hypothetical protein
MGRDIYMAMNSVLKRGKRMSTRKGWRLVAPGGQVFKAIEKSRTKIGGKKVIVFVVLPHPISND